MRGHMPEEFSQALWCTGTMRVVVASAAMFGILALLPLLLYGLRRSFSFLGRGIVEEFAVTLGA